MQNKILEVRNVSKKYGKKEVLRNVSFVIYSGEIVGLVGPNGAGKTTLMAIIAGLIRNYEGNIYIDGRNIKEGSVEKKQVGCVIESPGFYPNLTGYENLKFFSKIFGNVNDSEINEVVKLLGLEKVIYQKTVKYSMGTKQRLGIAQAVLGDPRLLVLDEPTNGLDPNITPVVRNFLKDIVRKKSIGILISSHVLSEIEAICDRVLFIRNGEVIEEVNLNQENKTSVSYIFETNSVEDLVKFFEARGIKAIIEGEGKIKVVITSEMFENLLPQIVQKGIIVKGIYKQKISLEERFIKKMEGKIIE